MNAANIPLINEDQAKRKPPKLIEKVVSKVEEALTAPADHKPVSEGKVKPKQPQLQSQQQLPQSPSPKPQQAQMQGSLGGSSEYVLPKGTTIKLPDGKEFETHTKSKIKKITRHPAGEGGGET